MNDGTVYRKAVREILADLTDRRGLRHEWEGIDEDIQVEIRRAWIDILKKHFPLEDER